MRECVYLLVHSQMPTIALLGQEKVRNQELLPGLDVQWEGAQGTSARLSTEAGPAGKQDGAWGTGASTEPLPREEPACEMAGHTQHPHGAGHGLQPLASGGASCLTASPEATLSYQELLFHPAGVSLATTTSRRRLSTIRASGQSSALSCPGEEPHTSAPEPHQQQGVGWGPLDCLGFLTQPQGRDETPRPGLLRWSQ